MKPEIVKNRSEAKLHNTRANRGAMTILVCLRQSFASNLHIFLRRRCREKTSICVNDLKFKQEREFVHIDEW